MSKKKKINIGSSLGNILFLSLWTITWIGISIYAFIRILNPSNQDKYSLYIPMLCLCVIFLIIGTILDIIAILSYIRMNKALLGINATAIVTEAYKGNGRNGKFYLTYEYKSQNGEDIIAYTSVHENIVSYFKEGKEIPILLNGIYGFYDLDELQKQASMEVNVEATELISKKYCISCGCELDKEDMFCKKCGTKQE